MHGGPPHEQGTHSKVPPAWHPVRESQYPLWVWAQDLQKWTMATELPLERQGPAVVMQLGGMAKVLGREMDAATLSRGTYEPDGNGGNTHITGTAHLLRVLIRRFGELDEEQSVRLISQLFGFSRMQGENIDQILTRFDLIVHRCTTMLPGFGLGQQSWHGCSLHRCVFLQKCGRPC